MWIQTTHGRPNQLASLGVRFSLDCIGTHKVLRFVSSPMLGGTFFKRFEPSILQRAYTEAQSGFNDSQSTDMRAVGKVAQKRKKDTQFVEVR